MPNPGAIATKIMKYVNRSIAPSPSSKAIAKTLLQQYKTLSKNKWAKVVYMALMREKQKPLFLVWMGFFFVFIDIFFVSILDGLDFFYCLFGYLFVSILEV
jgi:hypothetical protein